MIAPMAKIHIAAPLSDRDALLAWLQDEEVVHIDHEERSVSEASASQVGFELAELQFILDVVVQLQRELDIVPKKSLKELFVSKPAASLAQLNKTLDNFDIHAVIELAHRIHTELDEASQAEAALRSELALHMPWQQLRFAAGRVVDSVVHTFVTYSSRREEQFRKAMASIPTLVFQEVRREAEGKAERVYAEIVVHQQQEAAFIALLSEYDIERVQLSCEEGQSIAERITVLQGELDAQQKRRIALLQEGKPLISMEQQVKFAYDALLHVREREQVSGKLKTLPHTFVIVGWIPSMFFKQFSGRIEHAFPSAAVSEVAMIESDKPPIMLNNGKAIQPFEAVTNLYGKPGYRELDPSGPLSLFFLIAFGLALTDAGYGILLMVGTLVAEKFFRLKREMKKMVRLLFLGGAMTFVLGALTGGWFGITLETLPDSAIKHLLLSMKVLDPITQPMGLLAWAFALGMIQLLFAWVVKGISSWRLGNKTDAILDNAPWVFIVLSLMVWVATLAGVFPASLTKPTLWTVWIAVAVVVATQGRSYKNPLLKVGGGVLSLFGLMSFVSDTLSYSRLLALGLATGIIGFVVNLLAGMAIAQIPFVGFVVAIGILVIGHTFNLGINALGAFIHSGRLQFVEFFPKFLEGGGLPYKPLGRVSRYVDNPKEFT